MVMANFMMVTIVLNMSRISSIIMMIINGRNDYDETEKKIMMAKA